MPRVSAGHAKYQTTCPDCGQDDVGVIRDWNNMGQNRYRMSKHVRVRRADAGRTSYEKGGWCTASRTVVPWELIYTREERLAGALRELDRSRTWASSPSS